MGNYVPLAVEAPLFLLQSVYDSWQIDNILASNNATKIEEYGAKLGRMIDEKVLVNPRNGVFLDSCYHHCGFKACGSLFCSGSHEIHIYGETQRSAFKKFYEGSN